MEKIKISEDLCNYIERLYYETNALQDLISRMKNEDDEGLNHFWFDKYVEIYKEYSLAKQEMEKQYIISKYGKDTHWVLNFEDNEVVIDK